MENLKYYIKRRLTELNINQSELARQLGISRVYVSNLLSGKEHMSPERLKTIFEIIGTPDLLTESTV